MTSSVCMLKVPTRFLLHYHSGGNSFKKKLMEIGKWAETLADEDGAEEIAATFLAAPLKSGKDV